jgi:cytochrome c oxidase subunit 2
MASLAPTLPALPAGRTALHPPAPGWDGPMARDKQFWMWGLWLSAFLLISVSFVWFFVGKQQVPPLHYAVHPEAYLEQVNTWVKSNETAPGSGIVEAYKGGDVYLLSRMWSFYPILKLKAGQTYTVWYSATDVVHNPIIAGQRLSFTAVPGHAYGITFTPTTPGTFLVYCAEYCGIGHQAMASKLIVEP